MLVFSECDVREKQPLSEHSEGRPRFVFLNITIAKS